MMTYKGYRGSVRFDDGAEIFHGEVTGVRDVVTFQGRTVDELKTAFHDSIDDYLEFCKSRGGGPGQAVFGALSAASRSRPTSPAGEFEW